MGGLWFPCDSYSTRRHQKMRAFATISANFANQLVGSPIRQGRGRAFLVGGSCRRGECRSRAAIGEKVTFKLGWKVTSGHPSKSFNAPSAQVVCYFGCTASPNALSPKERGDRRFPAPISVSFTNWQRLDVPKVAKTS